ncbi:methyltransferase domain-containing protein [Chytriomyces sp. MP71]|nr:methyltransferase domain-containing protein [Chytriomyces sp. MP71]
MSRKKLHEVSRLATLVLHTLEKSSYANTTIVIDVGAGQGYLTHRLAAAHACIAVDFDEIQTVGSKTRGRELQRGRIKDASAERHEILYRTMRINEAGLVGLVEELGRESPEEWKYALVGLHACGDLSANTMLGAFRTSKAIKMLAVVPCCFNLITEPNGNDDASCNASGQHGFPLSKHLTELCSAYPCLSPLASSLHNHANRALLSALLLHFNLADETTEPTRGPAAENETRIPTPAGSHHKFRLNGLDAATLEGPFVPYAMEALVRLGLAGRVTEEEVRAFSELPKYANAENEVFIVHCVRSLLSRVVESLLLMDRALFLQEMEEDERGGDGMQWDMLNLFDLDVSPRNMVFVASKGK